MKCPFCIKVCSKCGRLLVAYSGNFKKNKKGKWGLYSSCKRCDKQYRGENKEQIAEYKKQYYEENKEQIAEKNKQYREEHKEQIVEYQKQYREENKEYYAEYYKQYREENKEKLAEYSKKYREDNPHIKFNNHNKRRQLEENQGNGITKEQWLEMMIFFDFKCAYSGEKLSSKKVRTVDHIVALNNGGLNEVWNCVPMYANYNYSKHTKDMEQWYRQQKYFSEERLNKIYQWIKYAYNKWAI